MLSCDLNRLLSLLRFRAVDYLVGRCTDFVNHTVAARVSPEGQHVVSAERYPYVLQFPTPSQAPVEAILPPNWHVKKVYCLARTMGIEDDHRGACQGSVV